MTTIDQKTANLESGPIVGSPSAGRPSMHPSTHPSNGHQSLKELAALAGLVARATACELDEATLHCIKHPMLRDSFSELDAEFESWIDQTESVVLEQAAEDYAHLFLLPNGPTSRLSMHVSGERATLGLNLGHTIRRACSELGLINIERHPWGNMPEDHVAKVYEILARAAAIGESSAVAQKWIDRIYREILQGAIPLWAKKTQEHARTPLYRCIAGMSLACASFCAEQSSA